LLTLHDKLKVTYKNKATVDLEALNALRPFVNAAITLLKKKCDISLVYLTGFFKANIKNTRLKLTFKLDIIYVTLTKKSFKIFIKNSGQIYW
jgi:hypothetical protein